MVDGVVEVVVVVGSVGVALGGGTTDDDPTPLDPRKGAVQPHAWTLAHPPGPPMQPCPSLRPSPSPP